MRRNVPTPYAQRRHGGGQKYEPDLNREFSGDDRPF